MVLMKPCSELLQQLFVFFCVVFVGVVQLVLALLDVVLYRLEVLPEIGRTVLGVFVASIGSFTCINIWFGRVQTLKCQTYSIGSSNYL